MMKVSATLLGSIRYGAVGVAFAAISCEDAAKTKDLRDGSKLGASQGGEIVLESSLPIDFKRAVSKRDLNDPRLRQLFLDWFDAEPLLAVEAFSKRLNETQGAWLFGRSIGRDLFGEWAILDHDAAWGYCRANFREAERNSFQAAIVDRLVDEDIDLAMSLFDQLQGSGRSGVSSKIGLHLWNRDLSEFSNWVLKIEASSSLLTHLSESLARHLAPDSAHSGVNQLASISDKVPKGISKVFWENYASHITEFSVPPGELVRLLESPEDQAAFVLGIVGNVASHDPAEAVKLSEEFLSDGDLKRAIGRVVLPYVEENGKDAAHWALSQKDPELRQYLVGEVTAAWLKEDSVAASEWVSSLDPEAKIVAGVEVVEFLEERGFSADAANWLDHLSQEAE